jgi:hypothetical protein
MEYALLEEIKRRGGVRVALTLVSSFIDWAFEP